MKIEHLNHAKDCVWCETRTKEFGGVAWDACTECPRALKENCPIETDIGDSVEYYKAAEAALEKQLPKEPEDIRALVNPQCKTGFCPNCGKRRVFSQKYCTDCGQALKWD